MSLGLHYKNSECIFEEKEKNGVPYLTYPLFERTGVVRHGFSTRLGGVSTGACASMNISTTRGDDPEHVKRNCELMAQALGVKAEDFTYTHQTHTTNVAVVRAEDKGKHFPETDGLVTNVPGICLVTFYADCVPLYFVDPVPSAPRLPFPSFQPSRASRNGKGNRGADGTGVRVQPGRHPGGGGSVYLPGLL